MARSLLEKHTGWGDSLLLIQSPPTDHNVTLVREGIDEMLAGKSKPQRGLRVQPVRAGLQRTPIPTNFHKGSD